MSTLYLLVGLPGVGKSTVAVDMARSLPALRLSADDLQLAIFGPDLDHPDHNARHDAFEAALWSIALDALNAGTDVILDFGFWGRGERDAARARAAARGHRVRLVVPPDPGPAERLRRIANRAHGFPVSTADMAAYEADYQPPDPDEL